MRIHTLNTGKANVCYWTMLSHNGICCMFEQYVYNDHVRLIIIYITCLYDMRLCMIKRRTDTLMYMSCKCVTELSTVSKYIYMYILKPKRNVTKKFTVLFYKMRLPGLFSSFKSCERCFWGQIPHWNPVQCSETVVGRFERFAPKVIKSLDPPMNCAELVFLVTF